jgi:O-antigen/teichoic acid export membrane protein
MADGYYRGLAVSLASRLISYAASFVVIWAFNLLGRDVFGAYALAGSVVAIVIVIGSLGMDQLVLYRQSHDRSVRQYGLLNASLNRVSRLSIVVCILFLSFGYLQTKIIEPGTEFMIYIALAATVPAVAGTHVYSAWHQALQDYNRALLVPRVSDLLRLLCFIPLGMFLPDIGFYLLVIVVSAWVPLVFYRADSDLLPERGHEIDLSGRRYAKHMMMVRLVRSSVDNICIIMVGLLTTPGLTAAFALGMRIASIALLGHQLLAQVTLPRIGSALGQSDYAGMMGEFDRHRWLSLLVTLGVIIIMVVFGPGILGLFGSYADALPVMYVLLGANIIESGFGPNGNALKMGGHAAGLLNSTWFFLFLLFSTNIVFIPMFGIVGAAYGMILSILLINSINWWQCYKAYGVWTTGPLAFTVILAGNLGVLLYVYGMPVPGLMLLCSVLTIILIKVLQGERILSKIPGF